VERIRYPGFAAAPQFVFSLAPKPSLTCETPDPTQTPPRSQILVESAS
jgi:hypothetical protein